jgi:hypothetical protein
VSFEPALSFKGSSYDIHPEMGLPAWAMTGMPLMLVRFIHHFQPVGRESFGQFSGDELLHAHGRISRLMIGEDSMRKAVEITSYVSVKLAGDSVSSA